MTVHLEVIPHESFLYFDKVAGPGGLPIGVSGRVCVLLSGGIDSPVAAYRMLQRGCRAWFVHFHGAPFLSRASAEKASDLAEILTEYQYDSKLLFCSIRRDPAPSGAERTLTLAGHSLPAAYDSNCGGHRQAASGAGAGHWGKPLRQVASQTLSNIGVIQEAAALPHLSSSYRYGQERDIPPRRERIGTYEISIRPDQDCCSLFVPKHPATRSTLEEVKAAESVLDVDPLVSQGIESAHGRRISFSGGYPPRLSRRTRFPLNVRLGGGIRKSSITCPERSSHAQIHRIRYRPQRHAPAWISSSPAHRQRSRMALSAYGSPRAITVAVAFTNMTAVALQTQSIGLGTGNHLPLHPPSGNTGHGGRSSRRVVRRSIYAWIGHGIRSVEQASGEGAETHCCPARIRGHGAAADHGEKATATRGKSSRSVEPEPH